ncbi:hypothetical protein COLSTE_00207 [Collinsella stercoris DSM 13279]|uniref:Uncharacterized protein n=1 Tax=Collinsella stercoris DSM 13279 TaxID=445975 RepID=B6G817_9ACTN|nr:hypothetical protein COLSTE_00207 [Collinsella stercoris DSM 13279]
MLTNASHAAVGTACRGIRHTPTNASRARAGAAHRRTCCVPGRYRVLTNALRTRGDAAFR